MAKEFDEDEELYNSIKPGNIDKDLFEMDDDDYEIDSSSIDDEYEDDENESEENSSTYGFDASDETDENDNQTIKDLIGNEEETTENLGTTNFDSTEEMLIDEEPRKNNEEDVNNIDPDLVQVMNKIEENNKLEDSKEEIVEETENTDQIVEEDNSDEIVVEEDKSDEVIDEDVLLYLVF